MYMFCSVHVVHGSDYLCTWASFCTVGTVERYIECTFLYMLTTFCMLYTRDNLLYLFSMVGGPRRCSVDLPGITT